MVASWSLMQEVPGSSPFTVMANIFVAEFSENILGKLKWEATLIGLVTYLASDQISM